jgi:hypothetical protein
VALLGTIGCECGCKKVKEQLDSQRQNNGLRCRLYQPKF